ncbi:MAG: O-antigen ligase family protein [Verrucomicrobiota bacterium]
MEASREDVSQGSISEDSRGRWDFWLGVGLVVHLAGIYFFENWVMQNIWGGLVIGLAMWKRGGELRSVFAETTWLRWVGGWLVVQFFLGFALAHEQEGLGVYFMRAWDVVAVPAVLGIWVCFLRRGQGIESVTVYFIALIGFLTAVISFLSFYSAEGLFPHARLMNQFVNWWWNNGLHPVLTGLTFAFAAVCMLLIFLKEERKWLSWSALVGFGVLLFMLFFAHTRGALLALAAGLPVALLGARNWRALIGLVVSGVAFGAYLWTYANVGSLPSPDQFEGKEIVVSGKSLLERQDAGRFGLYRVLLEGNTSAIDWIIGRGLWAKDHGKDDGMTEWAFHPHSIFVSMLVHHGIVGMAFLAWFLGLAAWRAIRLWLTGRPEWLSLLAFGCAGQLFDGHLVFSLTSIPRIEPLLILFPAAVALTLGSPKLKST